MSMRFITTTAFSCGLAVFLSACSAANSVPAAEMENPSGDYVKTSKPGASVSFTHNADELGTDTQSKDVKVSISDGYDSGILTVQVIQNKSLAVAGGSGTYTFDMSGSQPHEIILKVNPISSGKHYLNFAAIADHGQGQVARASYALPIYAGVEPTKGRIQTVTDAPRKIENPGVIAMDAEEEIITQAPE